MIRETKVGLVVTCSFLGLLGVVVTSKLNEKKVNADSAEVVDGSRSESASSVEPPRKDIDPTSAKTKPPKRLPAGVEQTKFEQPGPLPPETKETKTTPEPTVPIPPMVETTAVPPPMTEKPEAKPEPIVPAPPVAEAAPKPMLPKMDDPPSPIVATPPMTEPTKEAVAIPLPKPEAEVKEPAAIPLPKPPEPEVKETKPEATLKLVPPSPPETAKEAAPPMPEAAPLTPMKDNTLPSPPAAPETVKAVEEPKSEVPPPSGLPVPMPPPAPESSVPAPPIAPPMTTPMAPEKTIAIPSPEAVKVGIPTESAAPPVAPGTPIPETPPMTVPMSGTTIRPPAEATPKTPVPAVVARTDPQPTTTSEPPVDRFVEEDYKVKSGENFASISKNRYGSEEYAEALAQYNRYDALQGPPVIEKDGALRPGQVVSLPDVNFLEKRYAKFVPHLKTPEKPVETPKAAVPTSVPKGPTYQVPATGQTMREIARLTLGNGERWKDIYHLNAQYRPDYAIPGGTVITLPADAKTPPR